MRDVDELVADYLAVGIDPTRATIFAHSLVPELNQLLLPFLSLVTVPELLRNPTVKEEAAACEMMALNGLMLTYPVHQAADILFCKGTLVPVAPISFRTSSRPARSPDGSTGVTRRSVPSFLCPRRC